MSNIKMTYIKNNSKSLNLSRLYTVSMSPFQPSTVKVKFMVLSCGHKLVLQHLYLLNGVSLSK